MDFSLISLSLRVALVATAINLPIALLVSWILVRWKMRWMVLIDILVSLPLMLPPVAIGFFLLVILGREGFIGQIYNWIVGVDIVFTWVAASIAAAVVSFPLLVRAIMVSMQGVDPVLETVARSLGAGPFRVALTITLPLSYRGVFAGVLLGFVRALSEFGATIVVAGNIPGHTQTLPLAIYSSIQLGNDATVIRLIAVSLVLAIASLLVYNWLLRKDV